MSVSEQLREAIAASGKTNYQIAKDTGVSKPVLGRWLGRVRDNIRSDTLDTLCDYLGLELCEKRRKRTAKK